MVQVQTGNMLDVIVEGKSIGLKQRDSDHRKHEVIWLPEPQGLRDVLTTEINRLNPSGHSPTGEVSETGWLLEKMHEGQVWYITANYVLEWTVDPLKALRLSRREDAEMLATIVEDCDKIASHEWLEASANGEKGDSK